MSNPAEAREIRGRILKILELDYPHEVSSRVIALTLNDISYDVNPAILEGYIDYLEEKGYVSSHKLESEELGLAMRVVKLTAHGKDLLEQSIPEDPGVYL